jgi:hypothetical protein
MKSRVKLLILLAGAINVLFFLFHLLFYSLFNWKETLACLNHGNWAIFQTFYLGSLLIVGTMAYLSLRFPADLHTTGLAKSISFTFSLYYLIRIAAQFLFFGFAGAMSYVIVLLCAVPAAVYMWAAFCSVLDSEKAQSASG